MFSRFKRAKSMCFLEGEGGEETIARFDGEPTVLEVALKNGVEIPHSCGGMGTCGTCRVIVLEAPAGLEPQNDIERDMEEERGFAENERQSCQLIAGDGLKVRIP